MPHARGWHAPLPGNICATTNLGNRSHTCVVQILVKLAKNLVIGKELNPYIRGYKTSIQVGLVVQGFFRTSKKQNMLCLTCLPLKKRHFDNI